MIEISQKVAVQEVNGEEVEDVIEVNSHWNDSELVILKVKGTSFTFIVDDLITAIKNAQETNP